MRAAKWHNEIEIFRQIKPCIILEGNILDQFQYPSEPFRNRHLPEYLYKLLKDLGYNVVVIYDESKGFYAVSGGQKDLLRKEVVVIRHQILKVSIVREIRTMGNFLIVFALRLPLSVKL